MKMKVKNLHFFLRFLICLIISGCKTLMIILNINQDLITQDLPLIACYQNVEKIITLAYTHPDGSLATTCDVVNLIGATKSTPCSCDGLGACTVGLTGTSVGVASFSYFVTAHNQSSNLSQGRLQITNSAPSVADLTTDDEFQMIEKIYTLNYTDTQGDLATTCTASNLTNVTQTGPCTCNGLGICTVGMRGNADAIGGLASFDYTVTANGFESNSATISFTINHIGASINDEWVRVPANAGNMGLPEFYVMKYEARAWIKNDEAGVTANEDNIIDAGEVDSDGLGTITTTNDWVQLLDPNAAEGDPVDYLPVSIATSQPWREINADNATSRCQVLGSNYQLISNEHWMAIARDLENQPQNWTGNSVGVGCLFRGNTGELEVGDGRNLGDSCGYDAAIDPDSGTSRDRRAIHTLSNGSQIYDLAGNIHEWVDWDKDTPDFQLGPTNCEVSSELPDISLDTTCDLTADQYLPSNASYTRLDGVGYYYSQVASGGATRRGGSWVDDQEVGLFFFVLYANRTVSYDGLGIRCIFVPSS